jgi:PilZ domain
MTLSSVQSEFGRRLLRRITEIADRSADRFAGAVDFIIAPAELPQRSTTSDSPVLVELTSDPAREKRAAPRTAVKLSATIAVGFVGVPEPAEVRNLSSSGLCFISHFPMGVGEGGEVAVTLPPEAPNEPPRSVRYQVRIVHAHGDGDQFLNGASIRRCIAADAGK